MTGSAFFIPMKALLAIKNSMSSDTNYDRSRNGSFAQYIYLSVHYSDHGRGNTRACSVIAYPVYHYSSLAKLGQYLCRRRQSGLTANVRASTGQGRSMFSHEISDYLLCQRIGRNT